MDILDVLIRIVSSALCFSRGWDRAGENDIFGVQPHLLLVEIKGGTECKVKKQVWSDLYCFFSFFFFNG